MITEMQIGDVAVDVMLKNIKNIHLSVYPPTGRVRISAPLNMNLDTIRIYAISKLPWIRKNQVKMLKQARETPREYLDRESHYVWGKRYLLQVTEVNTTQCITLKHRELVLNVRPETTLAQKRMLLDAWYREQIKEAAPLLIQKWEKLMSVTVSNFYVQKMKTKWGSCNVVSNNIRLNSELAKKPIEYLEYVIVHELVHLIEPTHNSRFVSLMEQFMPKWKAYRDQLNQLPLQG